MVNLPVRCYDCGVGCGVEVEIGSGVCSSSGRFFAVSRTLTHSRNVGIGNLLHGKLGTILKAALSPPDVSVWLRLHWRAKTDGRRQRQDRQRRSTQNSQRRRRRQKRNGPVRLRLVSPKLNSSCRAVINRSPRRARSNTRLKRSNSARSSPNLFCACREAADLDVPNSCRGAATPVPTSGRGPRSTDCSLRSQPRPRTSTRSHRPTHTL